MADAISDTGPILHLHEIGQVQTLAVFSGIEVPDLVSRELTSRGILITQVLPGQDPLREVQVAPHEWRAALTGAGEAILQPADCQVLALSDRAPVTTVTLTDDLELRRVLMGRGRVVTGTIGILVRAYTVRIIERTQLNSAIDDLFERSTLHLSRAFRSYVRQLIADLP